MQSIRVPVVRQLTQKSLCAMSSLVPRWGYSYAPGDQLEGQVNARQSYKYSTQSPVASSFPL